jgi:hypothetical protein
MYAQDTQIEQAFIWPGFGFGGMGGGNAPFPGFFNKTDAGYAVPLNMAAAWKLQGKLVTKTPDRVQVNGSSPDGFAVLAGRSKTRDEVRILLNNYQLLNYDIIREIAAQTVSNWLLLSPKTYD